MFNPIRYVDNNFEDVHLSDADLRSFCEDFLVRLANPDNNPSSIYSTLLTDSTTKYNAYYGKMSSEAVKKAIAEGATITRNNARKTVQEKIDAMQGFAKFKYGEGSGEYQEMYPLGMMEYTRANEGDVGTLFDRFVTAATTHLDAYYHTEVLDVTDAVTAFHDAYTARETVVSQVDVLITGKNTDRLALTTQLTKDFLIIASNNISNPDKFDDYFDPRFLPIESSGTRIRAAHVTVAAGAIGNFDVSHLGINFEHVTTIAFEAKDSPGDFYAGIAPDSEPGATFLSVAIDTTAERSNEEAELQLGADETHTFLNVKNTGADIGHYTLTFTEAV